MQPVIPQANKPTRALVVLLVWALVLVPIAPYAMGHDDGSLPCHTEQQLMPDCPHCTGEGSAFSCQYLEQISPSQLANPLAHVTFVSRAIALMRIDLYTPLPHSPIYRQDKPPRYST